MNMPEKIEQSKKYPDEDTSFVMGNCFDKKETAEIVRRYNVHKMLLEACNGLALSLSENSDDYPDSDYYRMIMDKAEIAKQAIAAAEGKEG